MYRKVITYENFNGEKKTKPLYFNISKTELTMLQNKVPGGFDEYVQTIFLNGDMPKIAELFENFILMAYGEKTPDGEGFIKKGGELAKAFKDTAAYDALFDDLTSDENKFTEFIYNVVPREVSRQMKTPEAQKQAKDFAATYGLNTNADNKDE